MKKNIKYLVGFLIIVMGLVIKSALNHNVDYWGMTLTITLILFAIGIVFIFPLNFNYLTWINLKDFSKAPSTWIIENIKRIVIYIILFLGVLGLEKLGVELNYQIRDYYLSKNTQKTVGYIKGIKQINISKTGKEDFYLISFLVNNEIKTNGLMIKYSEKDNNFSKVLNRGILKKNMLTINKINGKQVEIIYSIKFPSFFRINE